MNTRIINCLDNLENLPQPDFKELRESIEDYYNEDTGFKGNIELLKELFKLVFLHYFPDNFDLYNIFVKTIRGLVCFKNHARQLCFNIDNELCCSPKLYDISEEELIEQLYDQKPNAFITGNVITPNKYTVGDNTLNLKTKNENIGIIKNNAITLILKTKDNTDIKNIELIMGLIEYGGRTIESYSSKYDIMTKSGFMPVSICKFDMDHVSYEWLAVNNLLTTPSNMLKNIDDKYLKISKEDIIFYVYTGIQFEIPLKEWMNNHAYDDSYNEAELTRKRYIQERMKR